MSKFMHKMADVAKENAPAPVEDAACAKVQLEQRNGTKRKVGPLPEREPDAKRLDFKDPSSIQNNVSGLFKDLISKPKVLEVSDAPESSSAAPLAVFPLLESPVPPSAAVSPLPDRVVSPDLDDEAKEYVVDSGAFKPASHPVDDVEDLSPDLKAQITNAFLEAFTHAGNDAENASTGYATPTKEGGWYDEEGDGEGDVEDEGDRYEHENEEGCWYEEENEEGCWYEGGSEKDEGDRYEHEDEGNEERGGRSGAEAPSPPWEKELCDQLGEVTIKHD